MKVVRQSKYRHVFGTEFKNQHWYTELRPNVPAWDTNFVKANSSFVAVPWSGGGGSLAVIPLQETGKKPADLPLLSGHSSQVLDFDFNPFNDNILASCSADLSIKIWGIPEGGLQETCTEALVTLNGHEKKPGLLQFHPTANNVLASAGVDNVINLWDIETGKAGYKISEGHTQNIQSLSFNKNGSLFVTSCKDKKLRIIDPRASTAVAAEADGHKGTKGSRAIWLGSLDKIFSAGFTQLSERQYMIWDPKKLDKPIQTQPIDVSSGLLMPFFDNDSSILFLAGKGDGNIRYFEIVDEEPYCHIISEYKSNDPQRGMGILPKIGCDVSMCEIARLYKLTTNSIIPIMFQVPRKSSEFQADLFPDTAGPEPAETAQDFFDGKDADPKLVSMKPGENNFAKNSFKLSDFKPKVEEKAQVKLPPKTADPKQLVSQNDELRARVKELEEENFKLKKELEELKGASEAQAPEAESQ